MMALVLALSAPLPADTVIPVERGTRLDIEAPRGQVEVLAWGRDAVRVQTGSGRSADVGRSGSLLRIRPDNRRPGPGVADFTIHVPGWMDVRVQGQQADVTVRGTGGEVSVQTVRGDVVVDGGAGRVTVQTIQGAVSIRNTRGGVEVQSVNQRVDLADIVGDVSVEATNGGITMTGIRSNNARARTVNGSIAYEGTILENGRYSFNTHNGAIAVHVPETANATVSAATYNGSFQADFPIRLTGTSRDRHYNFTLGSGSARMELESFNGDIRLRRPR